MLVGLAVPFDDNPLRRLANVEADSRDPLFDRPLNGDELRRAGDVVPDDATYYVDASSADPTLQGNLKAGAQLFLAPALPVTSAEHADWVLLYTRDGHVRAMRR